MYVLVCVLRHSSHVWLCVTLLTVGSSVHGILQARILEWVVMPSSRESSWLRDQIHVSASAGRQVGSLPLAPSGKPMEMMPLPKSDSLRGQDFSVMKVKAPHFVYSVAFGSTVSRQWKRLASMAQTPHRRITKDRTKLICLRAKVCTSFFQVSFTVSFPRRHQAQPEVQQLAWGQVSKPVAEVGPINPLSAVFACDWNPKAQHHIVEVKHRFQWSCYNRVFIPGYSLQVHIPDWLLNVSSTGMSSRPLQLNTSWSGSPPFSPDSLSSQVLILDNSATIHPRQKPGAPAELLVQFLPPSGLLPPISSHGHQQHSSEGNLPRYVILTKAARAFHMPLFPCLVFPIGLVRS